MGALELGCLGEGSDSSIQYFLKNSIKNIPDFSRPGVKIFAMRVEPLGRPPLPEEITIPVVNEKGDNSLALTEASCNL
jgi:hypothetical protein